MKIGKTGMSFNATLKISVPKNMIDANDKGRLFPSKLAKTIALADKHKNSVYIAEDIIIPNADGSLEEDLVKNDIPYEIVDNKLNFTV